MNKEVLKDFQRIPGIGKACSIDLWNLGYRSVEELKGEDPEVMYEKLCEFQGQHIDRCMLYTFRCAVYFAETKNPKPDKLKWWNWKDKK